MRIDTGTPLIAKNSAPRSPRARTFPMGVSGEGTLVKLSGTIVLRMYHSPNTIAILEIKRENESVGGIDCRQVKRRWGGVEGR